MPTLSLYFLSMSFLFPSKVFSFSFLVFLSTASSFARYSKSEPWRIIFCLPILYKVEMGRFQRTGKRVVGKFGLRAKGKRRSQKKKWQKHKTKRNQKRIGGAGEPIERSDIMYQDDLVCILKPDVKKGIIIWSHYTQPQGMASLCEFGLMTGEQLRLQGIEFGRDKIHPYIFFRAPYFSREIDYSTPETEIRSSYGENLYLPSKVFIRVDPNRTYVFSSEIRARLPGVVFDMDGNPRPLAPAVSLRVRGQSFSRPSFPLASPSFRPSPIMPLTDPRHPELKRKYETGEVNKSKKLLSTYLQIIRENEQIELPPYESGYHLFTSRKFKRSEPVWKRPDIYPMNNEPIERNSEILVSLPHLTPDYFVLCTPPEN